MPGLDDDYYFSCSKFYKYGILGFEVSNKILKCFLLVKGPGGASGLSAGLLIHVIAKFDPKWELDIFCV